MNCRHCGSLVSHEFLDLGHAPLSNGYLRAEDMNRAERYFPLRLKVCEECWLVQTEDYARADELFGSDYAYFSSTSNTWLTHAAKYSRRIVKELALGSRSFVVEIASNDGYLLRNFVASSIPCMGIEPTASTADAAEKLGISVLRSFFGESLGLQLAHEGKQADLIIANNVFAHVPDINDFARGIKALLKPHGTATLEFPHLMRMIEGTQFDTAYHEHFSYLSLYSVSRIMAAAGLRIRHVEELQSHGGSIRVHVIHDSDPRPAAVSVALLLDAEEKAGLRSLDVYHGFQSRADCVKDGLLTFLIDAKREGKSVAAYGAAAKGNTLLNYAGVKKDLLPYVCDAALSKQGKFMPGSHVPIFPPEVLAERRPDYVLILPWNIAKEVCAQYADLLADGVRFFRAVPSLEEV